DAVHLLKTVAEHGAVDLAKDRLAHLDDQVRSDPEDIAVEGSMMDLAESQSVGYHGIPSGLIVSDDVGGVDGVQHDGAGTWRKTGGKPQAPVIERGADGGVVPPPGGGGPAEGNGPATGGRAADSRPPPPRTLSGLGLRPRPRPASGADRHPWRYRRNRPGRHL